ncbi:MAG: hypothetical protein ABI838_09565, partial [Chloroflexota bacterium]
PGTAWRNAALEQQARGARLETARAGGTLRLAGFELEFPVAAAGLAVRAVGPGGHALCAFGDLDLDAQAQAAARLRGPCEYLVLPGGGRSVPAPALLTRARPQLVIASIAGGQTARGLPAGKLRRTDQEGTLQLPM